MKKILLATLLSIAMSENILMENYLRPKTVWIRSKQFGNKKIKRAALNEISSEMEEISNYDNEKHLPRISKTRFISDSKKLPSLTFMRPSDLALLPQVELLSSDKPKLDSAKPTVLISIDIQEGENVNDNSQKDSSRIKNHRKQDENWYIQQPLYVEEPRWINIYPNMDNLYEYVKNADPYILSRGKKIFRKDAEQIKKMFENYKDFSKKYPNRSKRSSMKRRVRRFVVMNEKSRNNAITDNQEDQKNEISYYNFLQDIDLNNVTMTKSQDKKSYKIDKISKNRQSEKDATSFVHNIFIKEYQKDKIKNVMKRLPYKFKFTKQNQISANDEKIINFVEQKQNIQREDMFNHIENNSKIAKINQDKIFTNRDSFFATSMNKRNKRSVPQKNENFSEIRKKYKTQKIDTSFEKNVKEDEIDVYEQMKNKTYNEKLDDLDMYNDDTFILVSMKNRLNNRTESLNKKDIDHDKPIEKPWKIQYYAYREKLESEKEPRNEKNKPEIDKNDIEVADSQLTNKSDSESSRIKNNSYLNRRKKRSACEICETQPQLQDQWLKDIEKELQGSMSLERRNKHSDILEALSLLQPYIISRGKKALHEFENGIYSISQSRNVDDANRIEVTSFPSPKSFLRMLLMLRCNNCDINANRLSNKRSSRNRRDFLDEILTAYDPYYAIRGKRINLDKFLIKMQNQKSAPLKTDGEH
ncbi:putative autophagy-related protein 11 [Polyergus mexicanus]|uniref:putative autophagy-related protein 11 n=1 Tax=Polyergus mexicanus TaxID=615972 RepID=UPI0038B51851